MRQRIVLIRQLRCIKVHNICCKGLSNKVKETKKSTLKHCRNINIHVVLKNIICDQTEAEMSLKIIWRHTNSQQYC